MTLIACTQEPIRFLESQFDVTFSLDLAQEANRFTPFEVTFVARNPNKTRMDGKMEIDILDMRDQSVFQSSEPVHFAPGESRATVKGKFEGIWGYPYRLKYVYEGKGGQAEGIIALQRDTTHTLNTRIFPGTLYAGEKCQIGIVVSHRENVPVPEAKIYVTLKQDAQTEIQAEGKTDIHGSVSIALNLLRADAGKVQLRVRTLTQTGAWDEIKTSLDIQERLQTLLITNQTHYALGENVEASFLALSGASAIPAHDLPVQIEAKFTNGKPYFSQIGKTDRNGFASVQFRLPPWPGLHTIQAQTASATVEQTIHLWPQIPFNLTLNTNRAFYAPGDEITLDLWIAPPFGWPEADVDFFGEMLQSCSKNSRVIASFQGMTNSEGYHQKTLIIPSDLLTSHPQTDEVCIRVTAVDSIGQIILTSKRIPVSKDPLLIGVYPEGGKLVPLVPNVLGIVTTRPDGLPISADVEIARLDGTVEIQKTNERGLFDYVATSHPYSNLVLKIRALNDMQTRQTSFIIHPLSIADQIAGKSRHAKEALYLKISDPVVDSALPIEVYATYHDAPVFLDFLRAGQIVKREAILLNHGHGVETIVLPPDIQGMLEVYAYMFVDRNIISDRRVIYRPPRLNVAAEIDTAHEHQGEHLHVGVTVQDRFGKAVSARIQAFPFHAGDPVFSILANDLLPPKESPFKASQAEMLNDPLPVWAQSAIRFFWRPSPTEPVFFSSLTAREDIAQEAIQKRISLDLHEIEQAMGHYYDTHYKREHSLERYRLKRIGQNKEPIRNLVKEELLSEPTLIDPWGNPYDLPNLTALLIEPYFDLKSKGPDEIWDTQDDIKLLGTPQSKLLEPVFQSVQLPVSKPLSLSETLLKPEPDGPERFSPWVPKPQSALSPLKPSVFIQTDSDGKATLELPYPKNLSSERYVIFAITDRGAFGITEIQPIRN